MQLERWVLLVILALQGQLVSQGRLERLELLGLQEQQGRLE